MFYVFHIPPPIFFSIHKQIYCMKILFSSALGSLFPVTTIGLLLVGFFLYSGCGLHKTSLHPL